MLTAELLSRQAYFWEKHTYIYHLKVSALKQLLYTVADYRRVTVRLQLKTLLPCILLLTSASKVQLR